MNRREFLKLGTAAIAAAALPKLASTADAVEEWSPSGNPGIGRIDTVRLVESFDPKVRWGNSVPLTYDPPPELADKLISILYHDMIKTVPKQYRDRVQIVRPFKRDYGRRDGLAWLYLPPGDRWNGESL